MKSNLILCFYCRPEHTGTDNCLGKLRDWCLNCVVSASWCFISGLVNFGGQRRCKEQQVELVITPVDVKEVSQMAGLKPLGVFHVWAIGGENCWSYCITSWGSCLEMHQIDFSFDIIETKADVLR